MTGPIDSCKAEQPALTNLTMDYTVRSADVNKPSFVVSRRVDLFGYDLTAKPIAVVVPL